MWSQEKFMVKGRLLVFAFGAALSGLLFGYNTGILSGSILSLAQDLDLSKDQVQLLMSSLLLGAIVGSLFGGWTADGMGRKKTLFISLFFFFLGSLVSALAYSFESLLMGRFITGGAIGMGSLAAPLYIGEISPPERRGLLVSLNQLLITVGIFFAYLISYQYAGSARWRDPFYFGLIPILIQAIWLFFIPETSSWLAQFKQDAKEAAEKIGEFSGSLERKKGKAFWSSPLVMRPLFLGVGIALFQQITGINTVIYHAPSIFEVAGYTVAKVAGLATIFIGFVNVVVTGVALWLIDRVERKILLLIGLFGMAASLGILGFSFIGKAIDLPQMAMGSLFMYIVFFAVSLGPITWLLLSEIFPLEIRGRAMGISVAIVWGADYLVSFSFLSLIERMGTGEVFWIYAIICVVAILFVAWRMRETLGKTFEEIRGYWTS